MKFQCAHRYLIVRGAFHRVRIYHGLCHDTTQLTLIDGPLFDRRISWTAAWCLKRAKVQLKTRRNGRTVNGCISENTTVLGNVKLVNVRGIYRSHTGCLGLA